MYRLEERTWRCEPDVIDNLWKMVEQGLPALVGRLDDAVLAEDDPDKWVGYAAMTFVRHPTFFAAFACRHQEFHGRPHLEGDQL